MDPVSLVLNALTSGAAQGVAESVSDAVKSAYSKLKQLVGARLAGDKPGEVALAEHAADPETWQTPLAKALTTSGAVADQAVIEAAQQLMALLDPAGMERGKYRIDLRDAQGVQVGDGNSQYNTFNTVTPTTVMTPPTVEIRPGQPRNEAAFGSAFEAAGGRARLGRALDEVYEDGPGWVQHFDGGVNGQPAVICALYEHEAIAVAQAVWNALAQFGRGTYVSGTAAVGFPVAEQSGQRPFIAADGASVELAGGAWGRGRLVPTASGDRRWQPEIVFDGEASRDQDIWSFRRGEMDLRLRLAARMPLVAEGLRVTEAGRSKMLAELPSTGLRELIVGLAKRYGLESAEPTWQETPEPEGQNNSQTAAYQLIVPGADGRPALLGSLWFMLPGGRATEVSAVGDLCVDFEAIRPTTEPSTSAHIPPELRLTPGELVRFFISAWQVAEALVLTTGEKAEDVPPAARPGLSSTSRTGTQRGAAARASSARWIWSTSPSSDGPAGPHLGDLSVGVTTPLGLTADEIGSLVRRALIRMAEDFGFTAAEAARF